MVDRIHLVTTEFDYEKIMADPRFNWPDNETRNKYEEQTKIEMAHEYKTLVLRIRWHLGQRKLFAELSLHKFYDSRGNWTDFTRPQVIAAIQELSELLGVPADKLKIRLIEFGANIETDRPPPLILEKYLFYKGKAFTDLMDTQPNAAFNEMICKSDHCEIKCYDKGMQYKKGNLMRFEIKVKKMQSLHQRGIQLITLADLIKPEIWFGLENCLLNVYRDIFKLENVDESKMTTREELRFAKRQTFKYWKGLRKEKTYAAFKKAKQRFLAFMRKYRVDNIHELVEAQLIEKIRFLKNSEMQNVQNITTLENTNEPYKAKVNTSALNPELPSLSPLNTSIVQNITFK